MKRTYDKRLKDFYQRLKREAKGKKTLELDLIIKVFVKQYSQEFYDSDFDHFTYLLNLLKELEEEEKLHLPKGDYLWDNTMLPALPKRIRLVLPQSKNLRLEITNHPWCPEMSWVVLTKQVSRNKITQLRQLNDWIKKGRNEDSDILSIKERSFSIFNEEKVLDELFTWKLFQKNVSLSQLKCYRTHHPFPSKTAFRANHHNTIIIENRDTFDSFWKANEEFDTPPYKHIIYGHGKAIEEWIFWVTDFDPSVTTLEYFGDLDPEGVNIPYRIQKKLAENLPSHKLVMALPYYHHLIVLYKQKVNLERDSPPKAPKSRKTLEFLSDEDHIFVEELFGSDRRIPQELLTKKEIVSVMNKVLPSQVKDSDILVKDN